MECKFEYSVAIRTVGKAGDKFRKELESLFAQTVPPKHVYVHLAHGFERPNFTVGYEEYIDTPKGLVHQRACSADGVEEEFLLILDDDVYFPQDAIEKMWMAMQEMKADGVAPDTFPTQDLPMSSKLAAYFANTVKERRNDGWAIKIRRTGAFSYNSNPPQGSYLPTQSAAGTALFVKTKAFHDIHYEDECWVDQFPAGTFGEDQLMFYKLYCNGYKILMAYDCGVLHLDANTNGASQKTYDKLYYRAMSQYLTWHRSIYDLAESSFRMRCMCSLAYGYRLLVGSITRFLFSLRHFSFRFLLAYIRGNIDAKKYTKSREYKNLPPFVKKPQ